MHSVLDFLKNTMRKQHQKVGSQVLIQCLILATHSEVAPIKRDTCEEQVSYMSGEDRQIKKRHPPFFPTLFRE